MKLQMVGCSHHNTPVEFRERLSLTGETLDRTMSQFADQFPSCELVVLSTCNRVELYTAAGESDAPSHRDVAEFLAAARDLSTDAVIEQTIYRSDASAVEHLFTVAASLDSMVMGEAQILSQVKQAYHLACSTGSAGPLTHAAFQAASKTAKRVQTETSIARRRTSIPSVAVGEIVPEVFDSLRGKRVVVCGAGEMGTETLRYLRDAGASDIRILNRSYDKAVELAATHNGHAERWSSLIDQVTTADLLIGTTSSPTPILDDAAFAALLPRRRGRILLILDLAVPRDFDPAIGDHDSVYLYSIDDLQIACGRNRAARAKQWPKAKAIITEETESFMRSIRHRSTGPVIARLRAQAADIKQLELQRLMNKLSAGNVDPAAQKEIEKSFDRLINKLLHPPLTSLKDDAATGNTRGLADALRHLFNLGDD